MSIMENSWFWFTLASTISGIMAVVFAHITLKPRFKIGVTLPVWTFSVLLYFVFVYLGMTFTNRDIFNYFVFFGWIIFLVPPAMLLYSESMSVRLFTIVSGIFLANVTTFISGGITTSIYPFDPYDFATGYTWSIPFSLFKVLISALTIFLYSRYLLTKTKGVFFSMEGKMGRFVSVPFVSAVGFFIIAEISGLYNIMPNTGIDFIVFYFTVCLIFGVIYWLIYSNVRWTSKAVRTQGELHVASKIQQDMLPCIFPAFPEREDVDIYATMIPAKEVGGDFYDFFFIDDSHFAMVVADVSGKGVPAALFMVITKTLIKNHAKLGISPCEIFTHTNEQLCENNEAGMFVTAFMGILDLNTGEFKYVNAGHNPPYIRKKDGKYERLTVRPGFILAGIEGTRYRTSSIFLNKGDSIYMYTDGVTEAMNPKNELFGDDRLEAALNRLNDASLSGLLEGVKSNIDEFAQDEPQFDDITMLAFSVGKEFSQPKTLTVNANVEKLAEVQDFVQAELDKLECPVKVQMQLQIATEEIFVNIAHYAYETEGSATIILTPLNEPDGVQITFCDEGKPYNPLSNADPDTTLSAEERDIGGLGIFMVKSSMTNISYEYKDKQNMLTIVKHY